MKIKKTPQSQRTTYKHYDDHGKIVAEYKPGVNGVTEVDIAMMHKMDDHEVYINGKELKLPEWYQPIYEEWKERFIADFVEEHGREPFNDEIPGRHRILESVDFMAEDDDDEFGDKSRLQEEIATYDERELTPQEIRLSEIVAAMPDKWKVVYDLVLLQNISKTEVGRILGISDVRVGQIERAIKKKIAEDEILKNFYN